MNVKSNTRESNFELLRIISMIMIIALHFNGSTNFLNNLHPGSLQYYVFNIIQLISIIGVNVFVFISGYYSIEKKLKFKKILKLWLVVLFYSVIILVILVLCKLVPFNYKIFIKSFFPILTNKYWFFTTYFSLFLFIPFINMLVVKLSKKSYKILLLFLIVLFSIVPTIFPNNYVLSIYDGYSVMWFIILYLIAGYIRLFYNKKTKLFKLFLIYFINLFIMILILLLSNKIHYFNKYGAGLNNYNNIFVLIETIVTFLIFREINIKSKFINFLASSVFAVYLIHTHKELSKTMWDFIDQKKYIDSNKVFIVFILSIILIFFISIIIDKIRIVLFKLIGKLKNIKLINNVINKVDNFIEKKTNHL